MTCSDVPTTVPVSVVVPLVGAVPVPYLKCIVPEPTEELEADPYMWTLRRVEYDGVIVQVDPSPIMAAVVPAPVGFSVPLCKETFVSDNPIALVLLVMPFVSVKAPVLPAIADTAEAHCGVDPAPVVCKNWPLVPGVRADQTEPPR